jgi:Zn-dependent protease
MFGHRWRLFRLAGIPIGVDASWLLILALLTLDFAYGFPDFLYEVFPGTRAVLRPWEHWLMGLITALAFFACIVLHELGHALVARARGMRIRGITLFLLGGVAEIEDEPPSAATEFLMAIAGPVVSLILAIVFWVVAVAGYHAAWPGPAVLVLGSLAFINSIVLAFNLVPAFPLDGGRVLRSILWGAFGNLQRATFWAAGAGQLFAWMLIAWGVFLLVNGNLVSAIWSMFIGWFLMQAAQSSYQQVVMRRALEGESVRRFMNPQPIVVPPSLDLRHWVEDYVYRYHRKAFPVATDGHLDGFISTAALARIPREEWDLHTIGEVMEHDLTPFTVPPDADALTALNRMQQTGSSRLLVAEGGRLVGILSLKDLLRHLDLKTELEQGS